MTRFYSKPAARLATGGALAMLLGSTLLTTAFTQPAYAGNPKVILSELEDDNSVSTFYREDDGHIFEINISADGKTFTVYDGFMDDNPNPESDVTGPGSHSEKPDYVTMIKSGDATYTVRVVPAESPELTANLKGSMGGVNGLGPRYNPGDDDNGNGPASAPSNNRGWNKTWAEIRAEIATANEVARSMGTLRESMGDGSEGSGESAPGANKGSNSGDIGDARGSYADGQDSLVGKTERDLLGPVPTIVNPPHEQSRGTAGGSARAGGSTAGGGAASGGAAHSSSGHAAAG
jgi:hypothetical protein